MTKMSFPLSSAGLPAGDHPEHQQDRRPDRVWGEPDPEERSSGRRADRGRAGGAALLLPGGVRQSGSLPPPPRQQTAGQYYIWGEHAHIFFQHCPAVRYTHGMFVFLSACVFTSYLVSVIIVTSTPLYNHSSKPSQVLSTDYSKQSDLTQTLNFIIVRIIIITIYTIT